MKTLLLRFVAPMQSWGTQSRYTIRETNLEPSKSGVIGLIYSALGKKREEEELDEKDKPSLAKLAKLRVGVRIDSAGTMLSDYQTIGGTPPHKEEKRIYLATGDLSKNAVISHRYYLADAKFLIGLESDNEELINLLYKSLSKPKQQIFFGRKSFVPSEPVWLRDGLLDLSLESSFSSFPLLTKNEDSKSIVGILETSSSDPEAVVRRDVPISFLKRDFSNRYIKTQQIKLQIGGENDDGNLYDQIAA